MLIDAEVEDTDLSHAYSICSLFLALSLKNPSPGLGLIHPGTPTLKEENGFPHLLPLPPKYILRYC